MRSLFLLPTLVAAACQAVPSAPPPLEPPPQESSAPEETGADDVETDEWDGHLRTLAETGREWSIRYTFPVRIGYTEFSFGDEFPLDKLTTLSIIPTAEFVRPLSENWTLLPFIGLGGGWLIDEGFAILILSTGVRAEWAHEVDDLTLVRVVPRLRYDANLVRPDNILGDWGSLDLALELRRSFGSEGDAFRFAPGLYAQAIWFWDDIEFDIPGLTPEATDGQTEVGVSLGSRERFEVLGLPLPRVFIGYRFGDGLDSIRIRFGDL